MAAQVLSGAGLAAGVTVGALIAQEMLGSTTLAGLPAALGTAGSALAAVAVGRISHARGRRPGLTLGYVGGAVGSAGVILAAVVGSPVLLFASLFIYGAGNATNLQARYAGADLATPAHRARAVSTVLVATTLGGVVGPNLASATGDFAASVGVPHLAGPFMLSGVAYVFAAVVLGVWLRPDPLLLARSLEAERLATQPEVVVTATRGPGVVIGALVMVLTQLVMVSIMTMTPVHMHDHGHGTGATGLVIGIHVAAMYLPSPLTGWLVDKFGRLTVAVAAVVTLVAAGVLAAAAPAESVVLLTVALALLGLGWNLGLVAGTAIITDALPLETRAKTQGMVDVSIAISGATGGMASGFVVAATSFPALAIAGGVIAFALLPVIAITARRR